MVKNNLNNAEGGDISLTEADSSGGKDIEFFGEPLDQDIQASVNKCRIPSERVHLGVQIGKGQFGLVYKARLQTSGGREKTVAAKTLNKRTRMAMADVESFLTEATMMINFKHPNVLSLIGVVVEEERPLVILPYMENGDLRTFIKRDDQTLVLADLLHFALQIANGMTYLANNRFVHRDLAARNCMVTGDCIIKVADFGLSKDIYELDYYVTQSVNKPLPVKWMSLESLIDGRFSCHSDAWSYGVTMWELLTRGSTPYPGVDNSYIKEHLVSGRRLDQPAHCPPVIYKMMQNCWKDTPEDRPTFPDIADCIDKVLESEAPADGQDYTRNVTSHISPEYIDRIDDNEMNEYLQIFPDATGRRHSAVANVYYVN